MRRSHSYVADALLVATTVALALDAGFQLTITDLYLRGQIGIASVRVDARDYTQVRLGRGDEQRPQRKRELADVLAKQVAEQPMLVGR